MLPAILLLTTTFLAECGPAVDPSTTRAIIQVESGGDPLAIGDNNLRKSFAPKTKREAVRLATELLGQGHSLDLGLMQINSSHLSTRRLSLEHVFDPCHNVRAGTTILAEFYRQYQTGDPTDTLMKALSAYNTGQAWKGSGYVNRILKAAGAQYRIQFVPVPDGAGAPPQATRKRTRTGRASSLFFSNTTSALAAGKGEQPGF